MDPSFLILTSDETRTVERAAFASGVASASLMEAAGAAVAAAAMARLADAGAPRGPAAIACGPGNNGGDGFVAARILKEKGVDVRVALLGDRARLSGDAALMASLYDGPVSPLNGDFFAGAALFVDALFGAGLSKPLSGAAAQCVAAMNASAAPTIAVDLPSGVDPDTGATLGEAVMAAATVTFIARKPGHLLFPGRAHCGDVSLTTLGIEPRHYQAVRPLTVENAPPIWPEAFQRPRYDAHKYARGAALVVSGGRGRTGAARLAARGALRAGAGVVTIASPADAIDENAAQLTAVMLRACEDADALRAILADGRMGAVVIGPGLGGDPAAQRSKTLAALTSRAACVIDADSLTCFEGASGEFFRALGEDDVVTPHMGEFSRLFGPDAIGRNGRLAAARAAAAKAGCVVVLKGPDTIIAAPDGRAAINANAPADLATAGSGDVLAGFIAGLKAKGAATFDAACAGVWLHGACGRAAGPGLIAEDLPEAVPIVFRSFQNAGTARGSAGDGA